MAFRPLRIAFLAGAVAALSVSYAEAVVVPPNFVVENAVPNVTFEIPTRIAFLPDGRMLVAEKRGRVWMVANGVRNPVPFWESEDEVLNEGDRGLLAVAADPGFATNRRVYFLYVVDPDTNGVDSDTDSFGRLTRYTVSTTNPDVVDMSSRTVLIGTGWADAPVVGSTSHSAGDLGFGRDGSLFVSFGDGAHFTGVDAGGLDPPLFEPGRASPLEDIGAFRAQWIGSLSGKILRIDPGTGHGYPSNPFWDGNPLSVESRVWCYGLRNPFRFARRPGTGHTDPSLGQPGTLYIGDVGWQFWEEHDVARTGGLNFGWPCYEGANPQPSYQAANPAHHSCDSLGLGDDDGVLTGPSVWYHHMNPQSSVPNGLQGNTSIGGAFYTGNIYPPLYQNHYFIADFGWEWIKLAQVDENDNILSVTPFAEAADGPVDIEAHPIVGDLFYVAILAGEVRRIRWTGPFGNNQPPLAVAEAMPTSGVAPMDVSFSSAGSSDPDGDPLAVSWNFGDGTGSTSPDPVHTYTANGVYQAVLTVDDGRAGLARDTVVVSVTGYYQFPSAPVRDDFNRPDGPVGSPWTGYVSGLDVQGGTATSTCCDVLGIWDGAVFGADQEAYFTFSAVPNQAHTLILKAQGISWTEGWLEFRYDPAAQMVWLFGYSPAGGYQGFGGVAATFVPGDRFGARAWASGLVQVFRNGALIGWGSTEAWPFNAAGGRLGIVLESASPARFDDFGGGDIVINTPPSGTVATPADSSFYVFGDTLHMSATASDDQQTPGTLGYEWRIDLHHGNHVHPGQYGGSGPYAWYVAAPHEDGTDVWYEIELRVTDAGGLVDTSRISVFPELDQAPGPVEIDPPTPRSGEPAMYRFRVHNTGRINSPPARWRLIAGPVLLAEGDVAPAALDSVLVQATVPPLLGPGLHTLRLVVDTLGAVVETSETNNACVRLVEIASGPPPAGATGDPPRVLALSAARPSPSPGAVSFALDLPAAARIRFEIFDLAGRRVWEESETGYEAGRWTLRWSGKDRGGAPVATGIYRARVTVDGQTIGRAIAVLR